MTLQFTPFIMLDGNAKEAIQFYEKALDAKVLFKQTFGEAPENPESPVPEAAKERLAHSVLNIGGADLFVADSSPGQPHERGNQVNICITAGEIATSKQFYEALQLEGQVNIPLQETHFSPAYGMVTDKFGITFQIFTKRQVSF
ncbi:VOC family protein [Paenibacillus piri]|uniref:VOC family protein n=1 Tax=Paenibacillus piri TaxID=2547395 RepID=A0A4V2ZSN3_9BACL|nr:VOC family protein [Paenibacillus piri]TDF93884.1 VOC family protein [Paenibacillus piri]